MIPIYRYTLTNNKTSETLVLKNNPQEWKEIGNHLERKDYNSLMRIAGSTTVQFSLNDTDGGNFLNDAYNIDGINSSVTMAIEKRDPYTFEFIPLITYTIDFKTRQFAIDKAKGDVVQFGIIEGGVLELFNANDEIKLEVAKPITTINGTTVTTPPTVQSLIIGEIDFEIPSIIQAPNIGYSDQIEVAHGINNEYQHYQCELLDLLINRNGNKFNTSNIDGANLNIFTNKNSDPITVKVDIKFTVDANDIVADPDNTPTLWQVVFRFRIGKTGTADYDETLIIDTASPSGTFDVDFQNQYTLDADEVIYFRFDIIISNLNGSGSQTHNLSVNYIDNDILFFVTSYKGLDSKIVKCVYLIDAMKAALGCILGISSVDDVPFTNFLTDNAINYSVILTGKMIRGDGAAVQTTFKELFQMANGLRPCMLIYNPDTTNFELRPFSDAYNANLVYTFDYPDAMQIKTVENEYFNEFAILPGKSINYEKLQGVFEPSTETHYSVNKNAKNKYEIKLPYNIDTVGIQLTYFNHYDFGNVETMDSDEVIFLIEIVFGDLDGTYLRPRTQYNATTPSVTSDSYVKNLDKYYNLNYTPKNIMLRGREDSNRNLHLDNNNYQIIYQSNANAIKMQITNADGTIANETTNEAFIEGSANNFNNVDSLYIPEEITFKYTLDTTLNAILASPINRHKLFKMITTKGNFYGYLKSVTTQEYNKEIDIVLRGSVDIQTKWVNLMVASYIERNPHIDFTEELTAALYDRLSEDYLFENYADRTVCDWFLLFPIQNGFTGISEGLMQVESDICFRLNYGNNQIIIDVRFDLIHNECDGFISLTRSDFENFKNITGIYFRTKSGTESIINGSFPLIESDAIQNFEILGQITSKITVKGIIKESLYHISIRNNHCDNIVEIIDELYNAYITDGIISTSQYAWTNFNLYGTGNQIISTIPAAIAKIRAIRTWFTTNGKIANIYYN